MDRQLLEQKLTNLGLEKVDCVERSIYQFDMLYEPSDQIYQLFITAETTEQGVTSVHFDEADIAGSGGVSLEVRKAAILKLIELEQLFQSSAGAPLSQDKLAQANNS